MKYLLPPASFVSLLALALLNFNVVAAEPAAKAAVILQPFVDRHALAGAVALVASGEKLLSVETVGFADIKSQKPMAENALFWIASQSKPMTAAAVMMLVDEGKLSLDDAVEKYLPEFKGQMVIAEKDGEHVLLKKPKHPITVRNVLAHTSGLAFKSGVEEPTLDNLSLRLAVRSYAMMPLQFEPDSKFLYSNAGINTAARILEVVSGMSYEAFMQKRLFDVLGMKDTTFWPNDEQVSRLAKSYRPTADKLNLEEFKISQLIYPLTDRVNRYPMPAGGLFSTAQDTARFCQMLLNGGTLDGKRVLSEAAVKQLGTRQTAATLKDSYGLGFSVNQGGFGHGGAHATGMNIDPARGLVTVWMVQHGGFPFDGGKAQGEFKKWAEEKFGKPVAK